MPNGAPIDGKDVWTVNVNANWLNANGELPVCIVQPELVHGQAIQRDESRPRSVNLASMIFAKEGGSPCLARWFNCQSGLLVFPEYAFGSDDFAPLHGMISDFPQPLIVLAGFGAVGGAKLRELLENGNCLATWPGGAAGIDPQCYYNAGWCWVHLGPGKTKCFLFLKNFFEQRVEIALVGGLTPGKHILKIATNDIEFYPLICADVISNLANSARTRIDQTLPRTQDGRPDGNKQVLVVALLYTDKPHHDLWRQAINGVVELHGRRAGFLLANQLASSLQTDAENDQWRNLSGGFIHKQVMPAGPTLPLSYVRYVETDSASGLILRQTREGVASGVFRWVDGPDVGRNTWVPNVRRFPFAGTFNQMAESVGVQELQRYVQRRRAIIMANYPDPSRTELVQPGLEAIIVEPEQDNVSPRLWAKLLTGVEESPTPFNDDNIDEQHISLDRALGVFAAIQQTANASSLTGPPHKGQLFAGEQEILVWNSPRYDCGTITEMLRQCAINHPREPQLVVIANGTTGYMTPERIAPDRFSNITESPEGHQITESRSRHIFIRPLGLIENFLQDTNLTREQRVDAIIQQLTPA